MVLLNTGLCLSKLEIASLKQGKSIVAAPQRFIAPGKRFLLVSAQQLDKAEVNKLYHPEAIQLFGNDSKNVQTNTLAWAKCDFCQHITGLETVESLSKLTVWSQEALTTELRNKDNLFLSFLRVFEFPKDAIPFCLGDLDVSQCLNRIFPLPDYINISSEVPVLKDEQFKEAREIIVDLKLEYSWIKDFKALNTDAGKSPEKDLLEKEYEESILDSLDWFTKIAEIGNSSDGNNFERLVRRSLIELGFKNSGNYPEASLDPNKLGGSGGLDFYCDSPYPVVGECKATKTKKVHDNNEGPAAQLIRLGNKNIGNHYHDCIKVIFAAGDLTEAAKKTARNNQMNVFRPETLQRLVELKISYSNSFDARDLKAVLEDKPFSEEADHKLNQFINFILQQLNIRSLLISAVKSASEHDNNEPVSVENVRVAFNHMHTEDEVPKFTKNRRNEIRDLLIELSSPFTGYLKREKHGTDELFYFIKELRIEM